MQKIYTARDAMEAHYLRQILEDHGLPAQVLGESLSIARGELPMTAETLPSVWVRREDADRAREVVRQVVAQAAEARQQGKPWTCPNCGETIEPQFDVCWKCQTPRPSDA